MLNDRENLVRLEESLQALCANDDATACFVVVEDAGLAQWEAHRPLMIIVHPGDAIEHPFGYGNHEASKIVMEKAAARQSAMAPEINDRLPTHDVFVLHRESSSQLDDRSLVDKTYAAAVASANSCASSVVAYGDDLDEAVTWLLQNGHIAHRPSVFLTGAYADEEYGCITAIGKGLQIHSSAHFEVSAHAPTDSMDCALRWNPEKQPHGLKP